MNFFFGPRRSVFVAVLLLGVSSPGWAQGADQYASDREGPSLAETTTWLKSALPEFGSFTTSASFPDASEPRSERYGMNAAADSCTMTIRDGWDRSRWNVAQGPRKGDWYEWNFDRQFTFSLARLDLLSLKIEPITSPDWLAGDTGTYSPPYVSITFSVSHVRAGTIDGSWTSKTIVPGGTDKVSHTTFSAGTMQIFVRDQESADRVVHAMKHAITLCGGTVDPF